MDSMGPSPLDSMKLEGFELFHSSDRGNVDDLVLGEALLNAKASKVLQSGGNQFDDLRIDVVAVEDGSEAQIVQSRERGHA
jgi:hypothetical protein